MIGENLALEEANMMMEHLEDQCWRLRGSLVRIHSFLDGNCLICQSFVSFGSGDSTGMFSGSGTDHTVQKALGLGDWN